MIAEDEVAARRHYDFGVGPLVGIGRRDVVLDHWLFVYVYLPRVNANLVAGNADHALDVALGRVAGIAEDHDVAALDRFPAVDELVDEDALLVVEGRHHAGAFNLHRLVQKDDDESGDRQRNDEVSQPYSQQGRGTRHSWEHLTP